MLIGKAGFDVWGVDEAAAGSAGRRRFAQAGEFEFLTGYRRWR